MGHLFLNHFFIFFLQNMQKFLKPKRIILSHWAGTDPTFTGYIRPFDLHGVPGGKLSMHWLRKVLWKSGKKICELEEQ